MSTLRLPAAALSLTLCGWHATVAKKVLPWERVVVERSSLNEQLLFTVERGNLVMIEGLLEARADVNFANERGETPLHVANNFEVEDINPRQFNAWGYAHSAADYAADRASLLQYLIEAGGNVNALTSDKVDGHRRSPLQWAVYTCEEDAVRSLLDAGADPNYSNEREGSPLDGAILGDCQNVARLLVDRGGKAVKLEGDIRVPRSARKKPMLVDL
eukprot:TRINITY_DN15875_c1_g2_i1.p1 TRINITY_DN15875_c1_g2~~TRINITY_DN15875_c1_g2_i1.p1  ORF type:complete len:216 (-),score=42.94 TRINITY_DN15875_c1_g2_i1:423-1070(-)